MLLHPARLENVVHRKGHIKSERFGSLWFSNCNVLGVVHCMVSESMPDKITNHQLGISLAVCAGAMAAMASVSAKLAMTEDTVHAICSGILAGTQLMALCDTLLYVLRAGCFASIFIFNSLMWTLFTKSLQHCSSTIEATITNTGANFLITALLGVQYVLMKTCVCFRHYWGCYCLESVSPCCGGWDPVSFWLDFSSYTKATRKLKKLVIKQTEMSTLFI
ncbi:uncharacterized protein LOC127844607 isoform X2 [Dreissena polymorpha]|uniref:uncharacterized protein LOC127844607 isoform X2 n=1 Tax=Dreissena polymorpha TaxID=45954 RepID=UPI002263BF99|nr:uncharacterized protein LOC127844607 isoform X2 [Dreissena polymorpha]